MHIPDGYLGPPTWGASWIVCIGLWHVSASKLRKTLDAKLVPLISISAAFSFIIMMFNIPIPGGTTGHAVGGGLIALVIGPWAASLAVSIALVIQALLFGDGGITSIGANCLNMAFVLPFTSYFTYRVLSAFLPTKRSGVKALAAGISGYMGLNAAAFTTSLMFGIQPLLHTGPDGHALYAPYSLNVAVSTMMLEHLLLFGFIEGLVTGLVIYSLKKSQVTSEWTMGGFLHEKV
ncbi:MAG: cobalt transporter CbiM [Oligoflexia bacterium]|nr:cobalt transporter CbiM [Oligoflexia bacterium]